MSSETQARVRWFKARFNRRQLARIAARMNGRLYGTVHSDGFVLTAVRQTKILGWYIRREEIRDEIEDPIGTVYSSLRINVRRVQFMIQDTLPGIEVRGSAALVKSLLSQFGDFTEYQCSIDTIAVDPLAWVLATEKEAGYSKWERAVVDRLSINTGTRGSISLKGDVRSSLPEVLRWRKGEVSKIEVVWSGGDGTRVLFNRSGWASFHGKNLNDYVPHAREALVKILNT